MSERDRIMGRLAKLKALAEGGVGGERENAARLLEEVAAKYGVDLDRLEESEEEREHPIKEKTGWRTDLMAQLFCVMRIEQYGDKKAEHCQMFRRRIGQRIVGVYAKCTDAQWVEMMAKYTVLARDYERHRAAFFRAFIEANDLLVPFDGDCEKVSDKELAEARMASLMALGIEKSDLRKQIEGGVS